MNISINFTLPFSPITGLLWLVVFANLALSWRTWISSRKNPVNITFALFALMASLWTLGLIGMRILNSSMYISYSARMVYAATVLMGFFFYCFSYYFPYKTYIMGLKQKVALGISTAFCFIISIFPNALILARVEPVNRYMIEANYWWFLVFAVYFIGIMLLAFRNLWKKYKTSDGLWKKRLKQVMTAVGTAFVWGTFFNIIFLLIIKWDVSGSIGPLISLFMVGYIWYHIFWVPSRVPKKPYGY